MDFLVYSVLIYQGKKLTGKGFIQAGGGRSRAGQDFSGHLILKYKDIQNEPNFNCTYSRNNLPKIKDGAHN